MEKYNIGIETLKFTLDTEKSFTELKDIKNKPSSQ